MASVDVVMASVGVGIVVSHGLLAAAMATALDPMAGPAIAWVVLEGVSSGIQLAAAIASVVQAKLFLNFAKESRQGAKDTKDAAILTEIDVVTKAMMADLRGGTTR